MALQILLYHHQIDRLNKKINTVEKHNKKRNILLNRALLGEFIASEVLVRKGSEVNTKIKNAISSNKMITISRRNPKYFKGY